MIHRTGQYSPPVRRNASTKTLTGFSSLACCDVLPVTGRGAHSFSTRMNLPLCSALKRLSPASPCSPRNALKTLCSVSDSVEKKKVIVISGPTGAGKSRLALELAKRLDGEIISADSVQVYRGLDVGSAKPSASERNEVAHHLLDVLHPSEDYSAGQFFEDARKATQDVLQRGRVPIVAGGTGLYLRWYIYGKPDVPKASVAVASEVCEELMELQKNDKWDEAVDLVVRAGDPNARSFPSNNWYRLRRSLEIIRSSGMPPSAFGVPYDSFRQHHDSRFNGSPSEANNVHNQQQELKYDFCSFFLTSPRVDLYRSIDLRCEDMLMDTGGLLSEASWLLDIGLRPDMNPATRAIGYRQAMEYLLGCREQGGRSSPEEFHSFLSEFQKASRNFAKRQITWFRNEHIYHWLDASKPFEEVTDFICDAYHRETGRLLVPESLKMKKEPARRQEAYELKSYRAQVKLFLRDEDCNHVLNWIRHTQSRSVEASSDIAGS